MLALQRATHGVGLRLEAQLVPLRLSQAEAHVLALLGDGQGHAVGELQQGLLHHPSTLSGILDRLEERRLVTRRLNQADRRSLLVSLTRAGRAAAAIVLEAMSGLEAGALRTATADQTAGFRAVVELLLAEPEGSTAPARKRLPG